MKLCVLSLLAAVVLCSGCAAKGGDPHRERTPKPAPTLVIEARGVTMSLAQAVRTARFTPFVPHATLAAAAVIPPLSDDERKRGPGIAMEYISEGHALLLSQWPREGLQIAVGADDLTSRPCAPVAYKPDGLLWTTRDGRVMTLQPDGTLEASRIAREARRLLRAGACGGRRTKTLPRLLLPPRRSRVVSLPRQSAS